MPSRIDIMMHAARFTEARTTACVDELLAGFSTEAVKQKLGETHESKVVITFKQAIGDTGDASPNVSGKCHEISLSTKPRGTIADETRWADLQGLSGAERLQPNIQRMAYARVSEQPARPLEAQDDQKAIGLRKDVQHKASLSKPRALSLQVELLSAFTAPAFQKKLHELVRQHKALEAKSAEYQSALRKLVRSVQIPVIVKYGFKPSEEGVGDMLQEFVVFQEDADIYVNSVTIREALFSPSTPAPCLEPQEVKAGNKPEGKGEVLDLLRSLYEEYSQPQFQTNLENLKLDLTYLETDRKNGYYHLPGRAELAESIQKHVLPLFGFEATSDGVQEMIVLCGSYLMDPDVSNMFDAINSKLGMMPKACQRFRNLAASLAGTKTF